MGEGADLTNMGLVYYNLGPYEKALSFCEQALAIRREIVFSAERLTLRGKAGIMALTGGDGNTGAITLDVNTPLIKAARTAAALSHSG